MKRAETNFPWLAFAAAATSILVWLAHEMYVISGPEMTVMEWLYDDCFYYVITAWHLSLQGISSFDGITRTSGYHPLWMWVCAAIVRLHPHLDLHLVRMCMTVSAGISAALALGTFLWSVKTRRADWMLALALGCSSYSAWNNGLTVMEWPLVVLCWTCLHLQIVQAVRRERAAASQLALAAVTGALLTLSRTDCGLIAACYVAAAYLTRSKTRTTAASGVSIASLLGAIAGLGIVSVYNHRMTGSWVQQSAEIKHLFAQAFSPFNPVPALWQFGRVLLFLPRLELTGGVFRSVTRWGMLPAALLLCAACYVVWTRRHRLLDWWQRLNPVDALGVSTAVVGIAAYVFLYSFNSMAMYGWYTAPVTGFVLLLTASAFRVLPQRTSALCVFAVLALNAEGMRFGGGNGKGQDHEVYAGKYLHAHYPGAVMCGGDVGKVSFYNNGAVFNSDGLMNNEVVPYIREGKIGCYLLKRHIQYGNGLGSITATLEPRIRERLGLPPLDLSAIMSPETRFFEGHAFNLFVVHPEVIRATNECQDDASTQNR